MFGSPYAALLLNHAMGEWSADAIEQDGSTTHMVFNPTMPPADFVPLFPGGSVVQSSLVVSKNAPSGFGSLDEVRDFYRTRLEAAGFTVEDFGTQGLNPA